MITEVGDAIIKIILIPKIIRKDDVPFAVLVKKSGYAALYDQIQEHDIAKAIENYPNCVQEWLAWSLNKKDLSGWYFLDRGNGQYFVGYFPDHFKGPGKTFTDARAACAYYIKQEMEECRDRHFK